MANIQFDEEQQYQRSAQASQKSLLTRLVLATGVVSTDKGVQYVLLGVAVLAVVLALSVPFFIGGGAPEITPEQQQRALSAPGMNPRTFSP